MVAYLNKQGSTRSDSRFQITRTVLTRAEQHSISLRANYILGKRNVQADSLSRMNHILPSEWTLRQDIAKAILQKWGSPNIDSFATRANRKLPKFFSPLRDEEALGEDTMQHSWEGMVAYTFPLGQCSKVESTELHRQRKCKSPSLPQSNRGQSGSQTS